MEDAMGTDRKVALITGASRGIGAAIAEAFAGDGYNLILTCDKTIEDLSTLSDRLATVYDITCMAVKTDMGDASCVDALFEKINTEYDHIDVLVNNAGISHIGLLTDMSTEEWERIISVNLSSCFYTCRRTIPIMLKKHSGHIINISSVWGNVGASMEVAYSASKGGVNSFTRALAKELAPSHIQVNAIACGVIDTSMNSSLSPDDMDALRSEIPADRIGKPDEVAALVLQTASAPEYMTGQIITIDGGWC
jgi:3-oxoacyl-[acyl-carrier protein] reductase